MDNKYTVKLAIESTDKYLKARQDLLQALRSYGELSPYEQECLIKEIFGAANVAAVYSMLKNLGMR